MLVQKAASDGALAWSMGRAGRRVLDFCLWPLAPDRVLMADGRYRR